MQISSISLFLSLTLVDSLVIASLRSRSRSRSSRRRHKSDNMDEDGFPHVGASFHSGDRHGKICSIKLSRSDHGVKLKLRESGLVRKLYYDEKNFASVSLR